VTALESDFDQAALGMGVAANDDMYDGPAAIKPLTATPAAGCLQRVFPSIDPVVGTIDNSRGRSRVVSKKGVAIG
jgi:hypothetical protein